MLDVFCEEKTLLHTVRSYWSEQFIVRNKTEESSDEPLVAYSPPAKPLQQQGSPSTFQLFASADRRDAF